MPFISELHYKNGYNPDVPGNPANGPFSTEFAEVALTAEESANAADYTVSFYFNDGTLLSETTLDNITPTVDPDSGLYVYRIDEVIGQPDSTIQSSAVALTQGTNVLQFYDIGEGTQNFEALEGAAAGAVSTNIPGAAGNATIQFDQEGTRIDGPATPGSAVVCFGRGTLIQVDGGEKAIEELQIGDAVMTRDHGLQRIRWIGSQKLSQRNLEASPNLVPIRISVGALGENTPTADLIVSPQHRVLIRSAIAQRMFGTAEVLAAAKHLVEIEGIDVAEDIGEIEYFHMLFDQHEIVLSNGAETESLYTGQEALKSVGQASLEEIFAIFPELRDRDPEDKPLAARAFISGRMAREYATQYNEEATAAA